MDKTIELVALWGKFLKQHPEATIDDFCRHHLIHQRESENKGKLVGGVVPMTTDGLLMKVVGRIYKLHMNYATSALKGTPLDQIEEFSLIATIRQQKNPRKSELIYTNLIELSSGIDILNRLKKKGLIEEVDDMADKRSKRVLLTPDGEKAMEICLKRILKLAKMLLLEMPEDDKQLCIQLLKHVEIKFSALVQQHKGVDFDTVYSQVLDAVV